MKFYLQFKTHGGDVEGGLGDKGFSTANEALRYADLKIKSRMTYRVVRVSEATGEMLAQSQWLEGGNR